MALHQYLSKSLAGLKFLEKHTFLLLGAGERGWNIDFCVCSGIGLAQM